jgi:hypothetical protein
MMSPPLRHIDSSPTPPASADVVVIGDARELPIAMRRTDRRSRTVSAAALQRLGMGQGR